MIDHIGLAVSDYEKSKQFYQKALSSLGYVIVMEFEGVAGFGPPGKPVFWIHGGKTSGAKFHVAFSANDRRTVGHFYSDAMAAGGRDNGKPGVREHYHPNYYAAFVFDPDGNNLEAVCHAPVAG